MRPVGANGDKEPELQPLPTMMAIRNGEMRILSAVAIAIGASRPVVAMLPGPADASTAPKREVHDRHDADAPAAKPHRVLRDDVERAVDVRLREQQRHARQREEQIDRKTRRHLAQRQVADVDADDPREREREQPDVQPRRAREHDRERQRAERDSAQAHRISFMSSRARYSVARAMPRTKSGTSEIRITPMIASPKFSLMIGALPKK